MDLQLVYVAVTSVIAACAAIAALTPDKKDDSMLAKLSALVNFVGLNLGYAKNEQPKKAKKK